jgi:TonB family protein
MRAQFLLALILCAVLRAQGPTATNIQSQLTNNPGELLTLAAPYYDFNDANLKPWHLKATYQLYDEYGNQSRSGVFEYWWISPKVHRSSWTRADATRSDWTTSDGIIHRKETGGPFRYFERTLSSVLIYPFPALSVLESGTMKLDLKTVGKRQPRLECVTASASSTVSQDYCFEPQTKALLETYSHGITTGYGHIVRFRGKYLARQVLVHVGVLEIFSASVDVIEGTDPMSPELIPPAESSIVREGVSQPIELQLGDHVKPGKLLKKTPPIYPMAARVKYEQGTVVVAATIGPEGKVHDLEVLASPSPVLRDSAIDVLKSWEYQPYLLNGQPVEVETPIPVVFTMGP